ncbi:MAG: ABC transporter permease [Clostridiales bacterium]|nr:ABC transporter permease [Clostridiales bacterium]
MIFYVIKNYAKLMCRSFMNVLLLIVTPIILIAVLSSAFSSLMASYEDAGEFRAGYRVSSENIMTPYIGELREKAEENGVSFIEYTEGDAEELIRRDDLAGFVDFTGDTYVIIKSSARENEGKILEYMMTSFERNIESGVLAFQSGSQIPDVSLSVSHPEHMPDINATDYYGIVEIVYFLWCGIFCMAGIINNEKKYRIMQKLRVAGLSETKIYLSKFIPTVAVVAGGTGIAALLSSLMFDIHWGNIALSALIVFMMVLASIGMGLMFYSITDNIVLTIVFSFGIIWMAGFFGGSFETYLFSSHPQYLKELSPIYYGNRALVELSSAGRSDYCIPSITISGVMAVVCSSAGILAGSIRKRGKA